MNLAQAAEAFLDAKARKTRAEADLREPERILKEHFRSTGNKSYRNLVAYQCSTYQALDTSLAKELLGHRVAEAMVERTRETLLPLKDAA